MKPCLVSTIIRPLAIRTMRFASERIISTFLGFILSILEKLIAILDGLISLILIIRSSAFEMILEVTTTISPFFSVRPCLEAASIIMCAKSAPCLTSGIPFIPVITIEDISVHTHKIVEDTYTLSRKKQVEVDIQ